MQRLAVRQQLVLALQMELLVQMVLLDLPCQQRFGCTIQIIM
jgi:hypothetical protein